MNAVVLKQTAHRLTYEVRRWDRRLRLVESLVWVPRAMIAALALSVLVAVVARLRPWLLPGEIARVALLALVITTGTALAVIWLWPRSTVRGARYFDHRFKLQERISTALELSSGLLPAADRLAEYQLHDAVERTRAINLADWLPLRLRWREIIVLVILAAVLAVLLLSDNSKDEELRAQRALQSAINEQIEAIDQQIEEIEAIPEDALPADVREQLTEPLQEAREILDQPDISQQEAMAALAAAERELSRTPGDVPPEQRAAYEQAANALAGSEQTEDLADALRRRDLAAAANQLDQLANRLDEDMSPEQREALAQQLEAAADALEATNPELAQKLREAAEQLRQGNIEAAQQALREAAEALREQQAEQERLQQEARDAAEQLREGQQELAQVGQAPDEAGDQQTQGDQQGANAAAEQQGGESGGGQQQQSGQSSEAGSEDGAQGAGPGEQPQGEEGQPGADVQAQGSASQTGSEQPEGEPGAATGGAGEGETPQESGQTPGQAADSASASQEEGAGAQSAGEGEGGAGTDNPFGEPSNGAAGDAIGENLPGDVSGEIDDYTPENDPFLLGGQGEEVQVDGQSDGVDGVPIQEVESAPDTDEQATLGLSDTGGRRFAPPARYPEPSGRIPLDQRDVFGNYFSLIAEDDAP